MQEQLYDLVKAAQRLSTRMYKTRAPILREGFGNHFGNHFGNSYLIQESHQNTYWEPMECPEKEIASVTVSKRDLHNLKQVTFTSVLGVVHIMSYPSTSNCLFNLIYWMSDISI